MLGLFNKNENITLEIAGKSFEQKPLLVKDRVLFLDIVERFMSTLNLKSDSGLKLNFNVSNFLEFLKTQKDELFEDLFCMFYRESKPVDEENLAKWRDWFHSNLEWNHVSIMIRTAFFLNKNIVPMPSLKNFLTQIVPMITASLGDLVSKLLSWQQEKQTNTKP